MSLSHSQEEGIGGIVKCAFMWTNYNALAWKSLMLQLHDRMYNVFWANSWDVKFLVWLNSRADVISDMTGEHIVVTQQP